MIIVHRRSFAFLWWLLLVFTTTGTVNAVIKKSKKSKTRNESSSDNGPSARDDDVIPPVVLVIDDDNDNAPPSVVVDDDDNALLSAESCNFPTGMFFYSGGCGGADFAVVFDCQGDYCTYVERRMVRSSANDGTASLGFRDDVISCTTAGTFLFPAMADTKNEEEENGSSSSSCRLGYRKGISLDEGTCDQEYKIRIDVGGDDENQNLMIRFSKDGGKTYYNEDEPRMAEPVLGLMMPYDGTGTGLRRRLGFMSGLADLYNQGWKSVSDNVNKVIQENIISATEFDSFINKVLALDEGRTNKMKGALQCQDRSNSDFLRVITSIGCSCLVTYLSIVPVKFLEIVLQGLTGQPTTVFNDFYKNPPPTATDCVLWIKEGCTKL